MSRIKTILTALLLFVSVVFLNAQDATSHEASAEKHATDAVEHVEHAVAEGAEHAEHAAEQAHGEHHKAAAAEGLPIQAPRLLGARNDQGFQITNSLVAMFVVAAGLILFAQMATRSVKLVPSGLQNFAEWIVESLENFLEG